MNNLPSWLSAIGTVGAFAVALFLLRQQIRDRRAEVEDRRIAQARLVSAWLDKVVAPPGPGQFVLVVLIRNGSLEPVYNVALRVEVGVRGTFVRQPGVFGPGETREFEITLPSYPRGTPNPAILFVDSAGRRWLRVGGGQMKTPTQEELRTFVTESPGAYPSVQLHPTLELGHSLDANRGKALPLR